MENQEVAPSRYAIDLQWYQIMGLSFERLVQSRLCAGCLERSRLEPDFAPVKAIAECCGDDPDFITPYTPTAEAIFRLFLLNSNQPMTVAQMEEYLKGRLGYNRGYRDLSAATIQRLLDSGTSYGFSRVDEASSLSQD